MDSLFTLVRSIIIVPPTSHKGEEALLCKHRLVAEVIGS
jgi:hypothetical protein